MSGVRNVGQLFAAGLFMAACLMVVPWCRELMLLIHVVVTTVLGTVTGFADVGMYLSEISCIVYCYLKPTLILKLQSLDTYHIISSSNGSNIILVHKSHLKWGKM